MHVLYQYFVLVDALVLKRSQAHTWNTPRYTRLKGNMTLDILMDGIKDSFVIHYFGGKYDKGKLKLKKSSPLIGIMEQHCPSAVKIIKKEIDA